MVSRSVGTVSTWAKVFLAIWLVLAVPAVLKAQIAGYTGPDNDHDGLPDAFEAAILQKFSPMWKISTSDCDLLPAQFQPGTLTPTALTQNGTIYGQVFFRGSYISGFFVEAHFYDLWHADCGYVNSHLRDAEHVAVLIRAEDSTRPLADWRATNWYFAAHEDTVCDSSQTVSASDLGAQDSGATVWVAWGKHAAFQSRSNCDFEDTCHVDYCGDTHVTLNPVPVNLGELRAPLNGSVWTASTAWPLSQKMGTNFSSEYVSLAANSSAIASFDGDQNTDLTVWRPSTGMWYVIPSTHPSTPITRQLGSPGDVPVVGDYDGDGHADMAVWQPRTGNWKIIPSRNPTVPINAQLGSPGDIPVPGDYDGDGETDLAVWRPSDGTWSIIPSSNPSTTIVRQWGSPADVPVPGDYDGDAKSDIAVWRPSNGTWYVIPSSSPTTPRTQQWGAPGDTPVAGDYDRDGKTDYAVWRPSNGYWYVVSSRNPGSSYAYQWGSLGDIPVVGDFDGDHVNDYAVWRPSTGRWYIHNSSDDSTGGVIWGVSGDVPVTEPVTYHHDKHIANFDGDRKSDLAVWRPSNAAWYVLPSSQPGTYVTQVLGSQGDVPVPGDYDADGRTDYALWSPSTATWKIIRSSDPYKKTIFQVWGIAGDLPVDIPVPGDYDGDGQTDFAVWRPSTGQWRIIPSSSPASQKYPYWGSTGDIPVPFDYDGDGKIDLAVWRPSIGQWCINPSSSPSVGTVACAPGTWIVRTGGTASDIPVPGDYDGDGKGDFAFWRPATGVWYVSYGSSPSNTMTKQWGQAGDIPVAKDYDGDGKADFVVWRPSTGTWWIIPSSKPGTYTTTHWGQAGDVPVNRPTGQ